MITILFFYILFSIFVDYNKKSQTGTILIGKVNPAMNFV
jgi:hypothetical protein